jgi:hypothetical protein
MLSYPTAHDRGKYLGIWTSMRNAGSIVGGAINFGNNHTNSSAGGVAWSTDLIFVGFEASGLIFASLLTQTRKVRRADGTPVPTSVDRSWRAEFVALWRHIQNPRVNLLRYALIPEPELTTAILDMAHLHAILLLLLLRRYLQHLSSLQCARPSPLFLDHS